MSDIPIITATAAGLIERIERLVDRAGTQVAAAGELGISAVYMCDILRGRRHVSAVAERLGYRPITIFVPSDGPEISADDAALLVERLRIRRGTSS